MTEERAKEIIDLVFAGESLKDAFTSAGEKRNFYLLVTNNPLIANLYACAQQTRAELLADEIVDIADNEIDSQKARNRIDARKWYASKMRPEKYGDRIDLNVTQSVDIAAALTDARSRLTPLRHHDDVVDAQLVEPKQITQAETTDYVSVSGDAGEKS